MNKIGAATRRAPAGGFISRGGIDIICYGINPPLAIFPGGHISSFQDFFASTAEIAPKVPRYKFFVDYLRLQYGDGFVHYVRAISRQGFFGFFK